MSDQVKAIIKKEKAENIVLKLFLIIICIVTMLFNFKEYREIFLDNKVINTYSELSTAMDNDTKFATINLSTATETRFSLQNDKKEDAAKIYEVTYGDYNLIVVLKPNTALTNKIRGEFVSNNDNVKSIKEKLIEDTGNSKKYVTKYFSDMDFSSEELVIKRKFYASTILVLLLFLGIIFDLYKFFNPTKTFMYKKMIKKLEKENNNMLS